MTERCPVPHTARKTCRGDDDATPAVELVGSTWHVRGHDQVREVLRSSAAQAGFAAETVSNRRQARKPVLYAEGEEHRTQRRATARFFAPATVSRRYRELMERRAAAIIAQIAQDGRVDLPQVTMRYAVEVAAQVVGLTNSDMDGMSRRLSAFFGVKAPVAVATDTPRGRFERLLTVLRGTRMMGPLLWFNRLDVKPAIAARRKNPGQDVISHLLESGYSDEEILVECITYGAAGMVTTREFISMATWHLMQDEVTRAEYLAAEEPGRHRILDEILRLEPVVGHLYRRSTEPLELSDGTRIPAGALLNLYIRAANADESAVGADPLALCPHRELSPGVRGEAMSFGDGNHRCPGNAIAIQETDIFLTRLLALPVRLASTPRIEWDELISGYAVRDLVLEVG